jgi:F-type H+-transporting ATPase subunit alpha
MPTPACWSAPANYFYHQQNPNFFAGCITPNDDITSYLSTNIMSITDGQIVFDLGVFRQGVRPAVKAGLSVSRVGGQAQTKREKLLSGNLFKKLAKYHQAEEFSHFGSSLSKEASIDLDAW